MNRQEKEDPWEKGSDERLVQIELWGKALFSEKKMVKPEFALVWLFISSLGCIYKYHRDVAMSVSHLWYLPVSPLPKRLKLFSLLESKICTPYLGWRPNPQPASAFLTCSWPSLPCASHSLCQSACDLRMQILSFHTSALAHADSSPCTSFSSHLCLLILLVSQNCINASSWEKLYLILPLSLLECITLFSELFIRMHNTYISFGTDFILPYTLEFLFFYSFSRICLTGEWILGSRVSWSFTSIWH